MYTLVGTHSAVKLCRWQKSMLRNRGGCYKWTMYGIRSHQCMESTPNIACANKCLFCWRLNTNPTMKEWKWDVDDPKEVVEGLLDNHIKLINNSSGMPGVTPDRLAEARQPRHCALSLVGEPIMYPRINEFVRELHSRNVSTFLVNNGQFPDAINALGDVTQLYLSVDSPTKEKMKLLDRPVFEDFWERFNQSVVNMRNRKAGRNVFRLTMIEDFNMGLDDVEHYVRLFESGEPHFVELKSLTPAFSGDKKSFLRISHVPTWERIVEYAQLLCKHVGGGNMYEVACVHEHSKCLLLAKKEFRINDTWHTWIDFDKFNSSTMEGKSLKIEEYMLPTPSWATFGADEVGFDPEQTRHITPRKRRHLEREGAMNIPPADPEEDESIR